MSQLEMGAGNAKLKIGIAAGLLATFGAAAYSFMGGNSDADAHQTAMPSAKPQAAVAPGAATAPESTPAAATSAASEPAMPDAAPSSELAAEPASSSAAAAPSPEPEPEQMALAEPVAESQQVQSGAQPLSLDDLTNASPERSAVAPASQRVTHNKPVTPRRPPAAPMLSEWWKGDPSSPFAVAFVGQAQDSKSLVILFSKPVNADQAAARVKLLGEDGKAVALNMDRGNSPRVLVQNNLAPGRYTVIVDAGTRVSGPVFIQ